MLTFRRNRTPQHRSEHRSDLSAEPAQLLEKGFSQLVAYGALLLCGHSHHSSGRDAGFLAADIDPRVSHRAGRYLRVTHWLQRLLRVVGDAAAPGRTVANPPTDISRWEIIVWAHPARARPREHADDRPTLRRAAALEARRAGQRLRYLLVIGLILAADLARRKTAISRPSRHSSCWLLTSASSFVDTVRHHRPDPRHPFRRARSPGRHQRVIPKASNQATTPTDAPVTTQRSLPTS